MKKLLATGFALAMLTACSSGNADPATSPTAPIETMEPAPEPTTIEPTPLADDSTERDEQAYLDTVRISSVLAQDLSDEDLIETGDMMCEMFDETGDVDWAMDQMYEGLDNEEMDQLGLSIAGIGSTYLCPRHMESVANYILENDKQVSNSIYDEN